jgi:hypothetical protein
VAEDHEVPAAEAARINFLAKGVVEAFLADDSDEATARLQDLDRADLEAVAGRLSWMLTAVVRENGQVGELRNLFDTAISSLQEEEVERGLRELGEDGPDGSDRTTD